MKAPWELALEVHRCASMGACEGTIGRKVYANLWELGKGTIGFMSMRILFAGLAISWGSKPRKEEMALAARDRLILSPRA